MTSADIAVIFHDAIWVMLKISVPLLMISLVVGVLISILQALTQIQETTLSFVPKLVAIFVGCLLLLPILSDYLLGFTEELYTRIANIGRSEG